MDQEGFVYTNFLHLWQNENIDIDNRKMCKKLDAFRFNIAQLQCLKKHFDKVDDAAVCSKTKELLYEYGKLVDSQDSGLNNYAEPILSLLGNSKNESKKWKCSLKSDEIIKKYITSTENVTSTVLENEFKVFAQHINNNRNERLLPPVIKGKIPLNSGHHMMYPSPTSKPPQAHMVNNNHVEPSFDLMESEDFDMFKDIPVAACNRNQVPVSVTQARKQANNLQKNAFGSHSSVPSQVAGGRGGGGGAGSQYPWKRLNSSNTGRGGSFAEELPAVGSGNNFGSFVDTRETNLKGKTFGGGSNAWNRNSGDVEGSAINQNNLNSERSYFKSASHQLVLDEQKKHGGGCGRRMSSSSYGSGKRSLGVRRTPINTKFVPPIRTEEENIGFGSELVRRCTPNNGSHQAAGGGGSVEDSPYAQLLEDDRLKNIDPKMVELIMNEIMDNGPPVSWDDIAGLELAKTTIQEIVVWPMLRPDIFTGLRGPPKGILLFGPPGTGKTMIGKCIACQSGSTFFSISASSLTSKWVGEGEKMVRAMFAVARCHQPSVIFIDEIDSLLTQRSDTEHESSRRIKTEFLIQLDGTTTGNDERILLVGATNRPQELDEAARRRLVKRLYIPLPEAKARQQIVENLMGDQSHILTEENILEICQQTDGYSGADMANLCREAALGPIRSISFADIQHISIDQVRAISVEDFLNALRSIRASVSDKDLHMYQDWNHKYGIS